MLRSQPPYSVAAPPRALCLLDVPSVDGDIVGRLDVVPDSIDGLYSVAGDMPSVLFLSSPSTMSHIALSPILCSQSVQTATAFMDLREPPCDGLTDLLPLRGSPET